METKKYNKERDDLTQTHTVSNFKDYSRTGRQKLLNSYNRRIWSKLKKLNPSLLSLQAEENHLFHQACSGMPWGSGWGPWGGSTRDTDSNKRNMEWELLSSCPSRLSQAEWDSGPWAGMRSRCLQSYLEGQAVCLVVQTARGNECHHRVEGIALLVRAVAKVLERLFLPARAQGRCSWHLSCEADCWIWGLTPHTSLGGSGAFQGVGLWSCSMTHLGSGLRKLSVSIGVSFDKLYFPRKFSLLWDFQIYLHLVLQSGFLFFKNSIILMTITLVISCFVCLCFPFFMIGLACGLLYFSFFFQITGI